MKQKDAKIMYVPEKFHKLLKMESFLAGKTMTSHMKQIANKAERQNKTIEEIFKEKFRKNEKKESRFRFNI